MQNEAFFSHETIVMARQQLGTTEFPSGSNRTKYGAAYGLDGHPWCVMFLWWVFRAAGAEALFCFGEKTASCTVLRNRYQARGRWYTSGAKPGDIAILNFSGTNEPEHCGIVVGVLGDGSIETVEGNTSPGSEGSQNNGGCVALKNRRGAQVLGFCRPDWQADYKEHWAEAAIRRCVEAGLMQGDPDGRFRPDDNLSRAEMATVLARLLNRMEEQK